MLCESLGVSKFLKIISVELRPKALDLNKRQLAVKLYNDRQHSIDEICQMMGISKPTLYNYVAEGQLK
jgi:transposase